MTLFEDADWIEKLTDEELKGCLWLIVEPHTECGGEIAEAAKKVLRAMEEPEFLDEHMRHELRIRIRWFCDATGSRFGRIGPVRRG